MKRVFNLLLWLLALACAVAFVAGMINYKGTSSWLHLTSGALQGWTVPAFAFVCLFAVRKASRRWPRAFYSYVHHREWDDSAAAGIDPEERALNAEDLVCKLLTHAQPNPNGPGLIIPKFMLTEAEALVPNWRERHTRSLERGEQAQRLRALRPDNAEA